jgi:hypothetical protein
MGYIGNGPYQGVLTGGNIQDGTVETTDLADGAVTTVKIADASVTATKLAAGAAVPSQSGQSGKYLTTDGSTASWDAPFEGGVVINESGADVDFRVESDTSTHALFVNAGLNSVRVKDSSNNYTNIPFVVSGSGSQSVSSGVQNTAIALFHAGNDGLAIGRNTSTPYGIWMQSGYNLDLGYKYPITLNPVGGNVGIGNVYNPSQKLHVDGSIIASGIYLGGTGAANYLDDYEEGTFTPAISGGTLTISSINYAKYTKVGRAVHIQCYIRLDIQNGNSSWLIISGLPFLNEGDGYIPGSCISKGGTGGVEVTYPHFRTRTSSTQIDFYKNFKETQMIQSDAHGDHFMFSLTYFTSA